MRDSFTALHTHIIWSTWDREALIRPDREQDIYALIKQECLQLKSHVKAIGDIDNHIHVLIDIHPSVSVAYLVKQIKATSSLMVNTRFGPHGCFKWQGAYGAFAVSKSDLDMVEHYILNQKQHHALKITIPELEWDNL